MHWIDIAAALAAMRHSGRVCVTAAVDNMSFHAPIKLGSMVILKASVNRAFTTSMEVGVRVEVENPKDGTRFHANTAYLTFVGSGRWFRKRRTNIDGSSRRAFAGRFAWNSGTALQTFIIRQARRKKPRHEQFASLFAPVAAPPCWSGPPVGPARDGTGP